MNYKENYQAMIERVKKANTIEQLKKLEKSNDNLYNNYCLKGFQFRQIDLLIVDKIIKLGK
jgi:hypothetical protein